MINQSTDFQSSISPIQIVKQHLYDPVSSWNVDDENKENIQTQSKSICNKNRQSTQISNNNNNINQSKEIRRQIETLFRKRPQPKVDQLTELMKKFNGRRSFKQYTQNN